MMNLTHRSLRAVIATAVTLCASTFAVSALAAGTDAGTTVSNTFTLDYQVGGVDQTQITPAASTDFVVDRIVDLTVTSQSPIATPVSVSPGQTGSGTPPAQIVFAVTNDGNDNQRYEFIVEQPTSDNFDVSNLALTYYLDDGDGVFNPGTGAGQDGAGTTIAQNTSITDDIAPDVPTGTRTIVWVEVAGDIPATAVDGNISDIILVANTLDPATWIVDGASGSAGSETLDDADGDGANQIGATDNVLADADGPATATNDDATDGAHSDTGRFLVASAALTADKTVAVLATSSNAADCGNTTTTPSLPPADTTFYPVPGACIEYVISVTNTGSSDATALALADELPTEVTFVNTAVGVFTGGTVATTDNAAPTPNPVTCTAASPVCVVRLTGATLAAPVAPATSSIGTLTIRALVE